MNKILKYGLFGLTCALPIKSAAQSGPVEGDFEDTLFYRAQAKGIDLTIISPLQFTENEVTYKFNVNALAVKGGSGNDTLPFFKNSSYKGYAADDSDETAFTVGLMERNNVYHHKINRSIPLDSEANIIIRELQTGKVSSVVSRPKVQPHVALNQNADNRIFDLLGRKVQNEMPKERYGIQMPNGVYINNKRKHSVAK